MATVSFQGITTGIKTDALIEATLAQEGKGVAALEARQAKNKLKSTALTSMKTNLNSFSISLAVLQDKIDSGAPSSDALQDVVNKYNALLKTYKEASTTTRGADGSIKPGVLTGDSASKTTMTEIRAALTGIIGPSPDYRNLASIGVKTTADGSLSLNTAVYQTALANNPDAVKGIVSFTSLKTVLSTTTSSSENSLLLNTLKNIDTQNKNLNVQINSGLAALARRRKVLTAQFSKMETIIAQVKAAAGSLDTLA